MVRLAIVDNEKLKSIDRKKHLVNICPVNRMGNDCITIEADGVLRIDEKLCNGCGMCAKAEPDAVKIINLPEKLKEQAVYRYGENLFELFDLPIPKLGKVIGILGVNGIGKSTAIRILANVIRPNLGNYEKDAKDSEITEFFKGTEAHLFFDKLKKGEIKVSYKPQQVELIPKKAKGKVADLLKKVDEKKMLNRVAKELDINGILENDIKDISGGELQRVAIAAAALKDAQLYIFDEPTSYLDIKQRLNITRFIRNLIGEKTMAMIVEHDLIALDYMTDMVHIMYGEEAAYGIVAQPRATKTGINTYLDGYLREENVRFRNYKIKFDIKAAPKAEKKELLIEWPMLKKKLGNFELEAKEGSINKDEIIGVVGENGIGKTSFVKILAGAIKPDHGSVDKKAKVSYKPQYIEADSNALVSDVLENAARKHTNDIIDPLNLRPLFARQIKQLSGGELQRVAIAECLARECMLFLLDEPSAYLDAEQRLKAARVIRNVVEAKGASALVVDHDLLFLDYLSDRLLVFDGQAMKHGTAEGIFSMEDGMNRLLKKMNITLRRDELSGRPRINKEGSVLDREQKENGKYYYA